MHRVLDKETLGGRASDAGTLKREPCIEGSQASMRLRCRDTMVRVSNVETSGVG